MNRLQYDALKARIVALAHSVTIAEEHESRTAFQERIAQLEAARLRVRNARLEWAMVCECVCDACETLSSAIQRNTKDHNDPTGARESRLDGFSVTDSIDVPQETKL
jgi:hypothetical protein